MGERDDARRSIEDARERMSAVAEELARRASPDFLKDRAREMAMTKSSEYRRRAAVKSGEIRDRAIASPGTWGLLGGVVGAITGSVVGRQMKERKEIEAAGELYEPAVKTYEYGYSSPSGYNPESGSPYGAAPVSGVDEYGVGIEAGGYQERGGEPSSRTEGLKERARNVRERGSEKAGELKQRASEKTGELRERLSGKSSEWRHRAQDRSDSMRSQASSMRERLPELQGRARGQLRSHPLAMAAGAIGIGMLASFLFPVTNREHELVGPAKDRAKGKVRERLQQVEGQLESRISGDSGQQASSSYEASGGERQEWSSPSASSAPYYGEDAGVIEESSPPSPSTGSAFGEVEGPSSDRTLH